jgi:hypothetical protein
VSSGTALTTSPSPSRCWAAPAVALYPAWWRQRYGEDQSAFLSDLKGEGRSVLRVLPNLVAGAARARLSGTGAPPTPAVWWSRTRAGVTLSTLPVMLLLPLMVLAGSRGVFSNGAGHIGVAARVAQHAGQAIFLASLLTLLVLTWGWRILVSEAEHVPRGTARLRYEAAMASPVAALGTALGLSAIASRVRAGGVLLSSSWAWSPTTHRYYGVSAVWTRGHPLLVASLHDAAWVFAIGGWVVAAALVGRAARRAPSTYRLVRSGVRVARATAVCAGALAVTFTVYELAIIPAALAPRARRQRRLQPHPASSGAADSPRLQRLERPRRPRRPHESAFGKRGSLDRTRGALRRLLGAGNPPRRPLDARGRGARSDLRQVPATSAVGFLRPFSTETARHG